MTPYQLLLLVVLILWPFVILGVLFLMHRLEDYVRTSEAETPKDAGLEPVRGSTEEREVRVVFGDQVVGEPK